MIPGGFPTYAQLPELGTLDIKHSWQALTAPLGALAKITAEARLRAARTVTRGEAISLNLSLTAFNPPLFNRSALEHEVTEPSRNNAEDLLHGFNPQASSQLDGLAHVRARELGYFSGITDLDEARRQLGMHHWAREGIATRGVLLDVLEFRQSAGGTEDASKGSVIEPEELRAVARAQNIELQPGDVLLVRTGWVEQYLRVQSENGDLDGVQRCWNGLAAHHAMAEYLWDSGVSAVGADNPAVESAPGDPQAGSLHRRLLPGLGIPLFELLKLDELGRRCRIAGRWEFLFVSAPLELEGGVSSTANAVALL